jgi:hypothetical protein
MDAGLGSRAEGLSSRHDPAIRFDDPRVSIKVETWLSPRGCDVLLGGHRFADVGKLGRRYDFGYLVKISRLRRAGGER